MTAFQLLLVRCPALHDQRPQVLARQAPAGVTQVEEEDIVDLVDHPCGSQLPPDGLQMLSHR